MVRCLHPEEAAGPAEIDQIDGRPQLSCEPAACIEQRNGIQRLVAEYPHIDITVAAGLSPCMASVEPGTEQLAIWECRGQFLTEGIGETIGSDHGHHHTRGLIPTASARAGSRPACRR